MLDAIISVPLISLSGRNIPSTVNIHEARVLLLYCRLWSELPAGASQEPKADALLSLTEAMLTRSTLEAHRSLWDQTLCLVLKRWFEEQRLQKPRPAQMRTLMLLAKHLRCGAHLLLDSRRCQLCGGYRWSVQVLKACMCVASQATL